MVSPQLWARIVAAGHPQVFARGETLLFQGDPAGHVLALLSGRVKITRLEADGSSLLLAIRHPGELLGEIAVLGGGTRTTTVTAMDECRTHVIAGDRFTSLVAELDLKDLLLRHAFQRLQQSERVSTELAALPARPRVIRGLLRLASPLPPHASAAPRQAEIGLDQTEFGEAIGLSRASVAVQLAWLRRLGLVVTRRGEIVVTDVGRLQELSETLDG
ncbi:Crp/Fnr family transcriptional regulator [Actinomadura craniellae]|uniref:Crp/Fnr family transcriptional regulator n=2 Tax=Actinomadura craniellae TaxID=2231787 RepID=A0A365H971_9ACTN|nr:Crp/Fnr family transcriptional regulator [Actinomadura craniellae]